MSCGFTNDAIVTALRELVPSINNTLTDLSLRRRSFLYDMVGMKEIPLFMGSTFSKLAYYGYQASNPFEEPWESVRPSSPGTSHEPANDACGIKWYDVRDGAERINYGFETKGIRSEEFCLDDWKYAHFAPQFIQAKMEALANVTLTEVENFVLKSMFEMAQKFVVTNAATGIEQGGDVFKWPVMGTTKLSRLTPQIFSELYHRMRLLNAEAAIPVGGSPAFFSISDSQAFDDFFYYDPNLRQDFRFSSMSDRLLTDYNIMDGFLGEFLFIRHAEWPRANIVGGEVKYLFPRERGAPTQVGVRSVINPDYLNAQYHLVLFLGRDPFTLIRPANGELEQLGEIAAFTPKNMDFEWNVSPTQCSYPLNNRVQFWTRATLGREPGMYPHLYLGMFKRRTPDYMAGSWGIPECIPTNAACTNVLPAQDCPCPEIVSQCAGETDSELVFTFNVAPTGYEVDDPISIRLANGSVASGTVEGISTDGIRIRIDFGTDVTVSHSTGWYLELVCDTTGKCFTEVALTQTCSTTAALDQVSVVVFNPLLANTAADVLYATFCDGFATTVAVVSSDLGTLTYVLTGSGTDVLYDQICDHGKLCTLCVVPTEDYDCPACSPTYTSCSGGSVIIPPND